MLVRTNLVLVVDIQYFNIQTGQKQNPGIIWIFQLEQ